MTTKQAEWASQHDWYRSTISGTGRSWVSVYVYDSELDMCRAFTSIIKLRQWAGY